jgi:hypothetical protein
MTCSRSKLQFQPSDMTCSRSKLQCQNCTPVSPVRCPMALRGSGLLNNMWPSLASLALDRTLAAGSLIYLYLSIIVKQVFVIRLLLHKRMVAIRLVTNQTQPHCTCLFGPAKRPVLSIMEAPFRSNIPQATTLSHLHVISDKCSHHTQMQWQLARNGHLCYNMVAHVYVISYGHQSRVSYVWPASS